MTLTRFEFTRRARPVLEVGIGSTVIEETSGVWDVSFWDAVGSNWNGDEPLWREVSCDVIDAHIELGRGRITDAFPVGTAEITVDNTSGWADPSIDVDDSSVGYFVFPGTAGNYVSSDTSDFTIAGDICIVFRFRTDVWPPAALTQIAAQDGAWILLITTSGVLQLWTAQGAVITVTQSTLITPSSDWRWYAVCLDVDNGAGGRDWKWWYGGNDDDPGTWVENTSGTAAGTIAINAGTQPMVIGTVTAVDSLHGDVSHLSIRAGFGAGLTVGGTTMWEFNGWDLRPELISDSMMPRVGANPMIVNRTGDPSTEVVAAVNPDVAQLRLRPGRPLRVGVAHQTLGTRWLYSGFIDAIEPVDDPENWSTVKMTCIDALGEAGRAKLASNVEVGSGDTARGRFTRILNLIQWPGTKRNVSVSAIRQLYAAEMDGQVVDLLRQTAESEGGWAFADTDGDIVLQHRDWLYRETGEPVDAVIGNITGVDLDLLLESGDNLLVEQLDDVLLEDGGDSGVCPGKWTRAFDRRDITTRVILDRDLPIGVDPLDPVVVDDAQGKILYGIEPFERTDLWTENTGDLQQIAGRIIATRAARVSMPRVRGVVLDAGTGDDVVDLLSALSIFTPSRYRGVLETSRGTVFDANFFAVGVTHDLSAEAWTADISLDRSFPFEVLDAADYIWDTARWDRSLWN